MRGAAEPLGAAVIPAKAGIHERSQPSGPGKIWTPTFVGVTPVPMGLRKSRQDATPPRQGADGRGRFHDAPRALFGLF